MRCRGHLGGNSPGGIARRIAHSTKNPLLRAPFSTNPPHAGSMSSGIPVPEKCPVRGVFLAGVVLCAWAKPGIVALLAGGRKSAGALCEKMGLPQPTVSHHLALLRHTGLLNRVRKGKQMIYSLNRTQLAPLKKFLAKMK